MINERKRWIAKKKTKKRKKTLPRPGIIQNSSEFSGFEPGTFRSSVWRSPNWAISAFTIFRKNNNKNITWKEKKYIKKFPSVSKPYFFLWPRPRLHGSGEIFARMNFVPGPPVYMDPCKFSCSVEPRHPGKNMSRFQDLIVLSERKVARFGCLHESVRNRNRAGQKVDLLFSGSKLAHLAVQKFVQFRRSRVNARWNRTSFCPCKNFSEPV